MFVRLAFAVAAHLDSDILIADEVLAVGDVEFQKKALGKMHDLSTGQGRTVLFVSHNMEAVKNLCNSGLVLEKGRIRESASNVEKLITDYLNDFRNDLSYNNKWFNNGFFKDPHFIPISLELQEENGLPVGSDISALKNYKIKLVFEIKKKDPFLEFHLFLLDNDSLVFVTSPFKSFSYGNAVHIANSKNDVYTPSLGMNTLFFFIPKNILNIKTYTLSLGAWIRDYSKVIIDAYSLYVSIRMNVVERGSSPITLDNSIVAPQVQWYVEYPPPPPI
jgi:lipopolysaccharide transport system ATP-binding protein